ncbi:hypothetical protein CPC08DRAFT_818047 [Agrocybe pediades]|nr:hypothetical protein CPC08DRAFT_818047 [Agrocybe pediades]
MLEILLLRPGHLGILAILLFWRLAYLPVHGSLFPTKPIRGTVYVAGQPARVTWKEDGRTPLLNTTVGMRIDLYAGKSTFVATLAKNVDPSDLSASLFIPSQVPANYHSFNLRFVIPKPPTIIYTANFNLIPNYISKPAVTSQQGSLSVARQAVVTVTSTLSSRISGSQGTIIEPSRTVSVSAGAFWTPGKHRYKLGAMDMEKMKFRLLFIVWPSLVGLSMAF